MLSLKVIRLSVLYLRASEPGGGYISQPIDVFVVSDVVHSACILVYDHEWPLFLVNLTHVDL